MSSPPTSRERILEAAIDVIEREGEVALRVDQIADAASITKPSIYYFFGDREGLVVAAQAERYRRSMEPTMSIIALETMMQRSSQAEFVALLRKGALEAFSPEGVRRRRLRMHVLGSAITRPQLQEAIREVHERVVAELSEVVRYGQQRGWLSTEFAPTALAEWWNGLIQGRHLVESYRGDDATGDWARLLSGSSAT